MKEDKNFAIGQRVWSYCLESYRCYTAVVVTVHAKTRETTYYEIVESDDRSVIVNEDRVFQSLPLLQMHLYYKYEQSKRDREAAAKKLAKMERAEIACRLTFKDSIRAGDRPQG